MYKSPAANQCEPSWLWTQGTAEESQQQQALFQQSQASSSQVQLNHLHSSDPAQYGLPLTPPAAAHHYESSSAAAFDLPYASERTTFSSEMDHEPSPTLTNSIGYRANDLAVDQRANVYAHLSRHLPAAQPSRMAFIPQNSTGLPSPISSAPTPVHQQPFPQPDQQQQQYTHQSEQSQRYPAQNFPQRSFAQTGQQIPFAQTDSQPRRQFTALPDPIHAAGWLPGIFGPFDNAHVPDASLPAPQPNIMTASELCSSFASHSAQQYPTQLPGRSCEWGTEGKQLDQHADKLTLAPTASDSPDSNTHTPTGKISLSSSAIADHDDTSVRPYGCGVAACRDAWTKQYELARQSGRQDELAAYRSADDLTRHLKKDHPALWAAHRARRTKGKAALEAALAKSPRTAGGLASDLEEESKDLFCCSIPGCGKTWTSVNGLQYHIQASTERNHTSLVPRAGSDPSTSQHSEILHQQQQYPTFQQSNPPTPPLPSWLPDQLAGEDSMASMPFTCPFYAGAPADDFARPATMACRKKFRQRGGLSYHIAHEHHDVSQAVLHGPSSAVSVAAFHRLRTALTCDHTLERRVLKEMQAMVTKAASKAVVRGVGGDAAF